MFNNDFYPTPRSVVEKMLQDVNFRMIETVLEPSAGKGDLVKGIYEIAENCSYYNRSLDIDAIEIEPELQMILKGKKIKVVYDDFLKFDTYKHYDLIVANPPFSQGAKHLLKMIEMQERDGGSIICLLNAETLKNPYTAERKALIKKLDEYSADIEYMEDAFTSAERPTNVEIAIVKIFIPKNERISFFFDDTLKKAESLEDMDEDDRGNTQVADSNFIKSIVKQFNIEAEAGIRFINEYNAIKKHFLCSFDETERKYGEPLLQLNAGKHPATTNAFLKALRGKYWKALFSNPKFTGKLTSEIQREYMQRVNALRDYDFSEYNIYAIKIEMLENTIAGVEQTIIKLFDDLSHRYSYFDETSNNIHYFNGWKTNKSWIINKKVIIPLDAFDRYWRNRFNPVDYRVIEKLADIEKCLDFLGDGLTENIDLQTKLHWAERNNITKKIQLKYFKVTFYKKGTCHIEFTDEKLLQKFNIFGAQKKNWLPPSYGKKHYAEMTDEEKAVIDEFQGKDAYERVVNNKDYYLTEVSGKLMLESA